MKHILSIVIMIVSSLISAMATKPEITKIKILQTSDVHGNFFPYDFINRCPGSGSLARIHTYVENQRKIYGDNLILIDNGDILQGQPTVYYYNFINTNTPHICAEMLNFMGYNIGNMGNHDIETGHNVYDRWIEQCNFPILGANIIDTATGKPYLTPYKTFERNGCKIAVLGLITPAIPAWLPETLWSGLRFDDMEESARKWVKIIKDNENPDIIIGVFHSGRDSSKKTGNWNENASLDIARNIPGFDIVLMGHDHQIFCQPIKSVNNKSVATLNPGGGANYISDITITFTNDGKTKDTNIETQLIPVKDIEPSPTFMAHFKSQYNDVEKFVLQKIGTITEKLDTRPAYFGSSAFVDFIHSLQLSISGAEISFAAPLSFDATINKGDIYMSDMFNLYKYENMLYVMNLTGKEIKDYLEYSYYIWTNQMTGPNDNLLKLKEVPTGDDKSRSVFVYPSYNFDSAAGIIYTIDVTKPKGEKITIISLADGTPFDPNRMYRVALNSYRGNGGGEILTKGAGIPQDQLASRIISATDKDLRYYLMEYIKQKGTLSPQALNQWKFIPEKWTLKAAKREYKLLFP